MLPHYQGGRVNCTQLSTIAVSCLPSLFWMNQDSFSMLAAQQQTTVLFCSALLRIGYSSTQTMEAPGSSKTLVNIKVHIIIF
jgi:hypothetical protein